MNSSQIKKAKRAVKAFETVQVPRILLNQKREKNQQRVTKERKISCLKVLTRVIKVEVEAN